MNIAVSIIIPVYNVEQYLEQCLKSAIKQTLKNIEIIVINDGSTDKSLDIIKKYELKYYNIRVINQENKGLSETRNVGLRESKGEYIYFLDSDDYIDINLAQLCYKECKKNNLDMITFDAVAFYDEKELEICNKFNYNRQNLINSNVKNGRQFYSESISSNAYKSSVCLYMYKREYLKKHELYFYPDMLHEDELFTIKAILLANRIKYIPSKFFYRRVRSGSIMTTKSTIRNAEGYYIIAEELYNFSKRLSKVDNAYYILMKHISGFYSASLTITIALENYNKDMINKIRKSVFYKPGIGNFKLSIKLILSRLFYIKNKIIK